VQSVLLLAPASIPAEHLLELVGALLPVDILLEGIQVEQGQHFASGVVCPEGSHHFILDGTGISEGGIKLLKMFKGMRLVTYTPRKLLATATGSCFMASWKS